MATKADRRADRRADYRCRWPHRQSLPSFSLYAVKWIRRRQSGTGRKVFDVGGR